MPRSPRRSTRSAAKAASAAGVEEGTGFARTRSCRGRQVNIEFPVSRRRILLEKDAVGKLNDSTSSSNDENSSPFASPLSSPTKGTFTSPTRSPALALAASPLKHTSSGRSTPMKNATPEKRRGATPARRALNMLQLSSPASVRASSPALALAASPHKQASSGRSTPVLAASPMKNATPERRKGATPARRALKMLQLASPAPASPELTQAKQALSTALPEGGVVGREKELAVMRDFLEGAWKKSGKRRRALYVSGAPGTGKTASLKHLLREMQMEKQCAVVFVNCMGLTSSKEIYARVAGELAPGYDGKTPKKYVEAKICARGGRNILLVLDEVDQLDSRDQEILYSVFEWPQLKGSRLSLVGIANALDLTDRILPRLKQSESVSPQQLSFPAYTRQEIVNILTARLNESGGSGVLKPAAVRFLAAKIAAVSGDIRKALDVCRRAIELAEIERRRQAVLAPPSKEKDAPDSPAIKQVDIPQVLAIFNQIYSSRVTASLNNTPSSSPFATPNGKSGGGGGDDEGGEALPLQQKLVLASLYLMCSQDQKRRCKEVTLGKLQETYSRVCKKRHMAGVDQSEVHSLCSLLEARGFFSVKKSSKGVRDAKVSLRIDEKEVAEALQDKTLLTDIIRDASCIAN